MGVATNCSLSPQALVQEIATKQPDYDSVCSDGKNILRLAHPQAVGMLDGQLQQLEKKWLDLRSKLGKSLHLLPRLPLPLENNMS